eukprot:g339.t1
MRELLHMNVSSGQSKVDFINNNIKIPLETSLRRVHYTANQEMLYHIRAFASTPLIQWYEHNAFLDVNVDPLFFINNHNIQTKIDYLNSLFPSIEWQQNADDRVILDLTTVGHEPEKKKVASCYTGIVPMTTISNYKSLQKAIDESLNEAFKLNRHIFSSGINQTTKPDLNSFQGSETIRKNYLKNLNTMQENHVSLSNSFRVSFCNNIDDKCVVFGRSRGYSSGSFVLIAGCLYSTQIDENSLYNEFFYGIPEEEFEPGCHVSQYVTDGYYPLIYYIGDKFSTRLEAKSGIGNGEDIEMHSRCRNSLLSPKEQVEVTEPIDFF